MSGMELVLVKTPGGALAPVDEEARALVEKLKTGQGVRASIKRARNVRFHRKAFALFKLAFDSWEPETPQTYKGEAVSKDFDRFRKDMTILAGVHCRTGSLEASPRRFPHPAWRSLPDRQLRRV